MSGQKGRDNAKKTTKSKRKVYTQIDYDKAIKLWLATGEINKTAEEIGISRQLLKKWIERYYEPNPERYADTKQEIQEELKDVLADIDLKKIVLKNYEIIEKSQLLIAEQLKSGIFDDGKLIRSLNTVCGTATDKLLAMLGQVTESGSDNEIIVRFEDDVEDN